MIIFIEGPTISVGIETTTGGDLRRFFSVLSQGFLDSKVLSYVVLRPDTVAEARELLSYFAELTREGSEIPAALQNFVAGAFERILNGNPKDKLLASKSLCLQSGRRGRPPINTERDTLIAKEVRELMRQGSTLFDASFKVSEKYHIHETNVEKIYCKLKIDPLEDLPF